MFWKTRSKDFSQILKECYSMKYLRKRNVKYLVIVDKDVAVARSHGVIVPVANDHVKNGNSSEARGPGVCDRHWYLVFFALLPIERHKR